MDGVRRIGRVIFDFINSSNGAGMKILLAHKFFHVTGGAEVFFFEVARVLKQHGHEVIFFSTKSDKNQKSDFDDYFVDPPNYLTGTIYSKLQNLNKVVYSREAKEKFAALLRKTKPDLVHVFAMHVHLSPSILVAAYEAKIPVVVSCNDYKHICPNYKLYHHSNICFDCKGGAFYSAVLNKCCKDSRSFSLASAVEAYAHNYMGIYRKYVSMYLFSSDFMANLTAEFWDFDFKWRKLINPFDSAKFDPDFNSGEYVLYFGRLVEEKGVDVLIRASKLTPDVKVKIVGDGPEEHALRSLVKELQVCNVEFLGPKWGKELDNLISRSRFVVVPSMWHENFPYVINQSFALGKPVIGSNRGGIPEMIDDGRTGLIFDPENHHELSEKINALWNSSDLVLSMGKNAKQFVDETFNDRRFYHTLMGIYKEIVDESSRAGR